MKYLLRVMIRSIGTFLIGLVLFYVFKYEITSNLLIMHSVVSLAISFVFEHFQPTFK